MEKISFNYSLKNIPLPNKDAYRKNLIHKVESFIKRIRWKAFFFENKYENVNEPQDNFGFKSVKTQPKNENLNPFESDLYDLVKKIEFKNTSSAFQRQLSNDIKSIKSNAKLLIPADKTNNLYELTTEEYNKLLTENISKTYKKSSISTLNKINTEAKSIAKDLNLEERIEQYNQNQSFITLKDHKENFQNNPKCRLINPAKSEIGIVSKEYIDQINNTVRSKIKVNQWRNTQAVIEWFKNIEDKKNSTFIKFDIVEYYPSILEDLLTKAINFAKSITPIENKIIHTIKHSRKSLLFNKEDVWVKKDNPDFDVTMGSFDGAEVCELVGLYLLDILKNEFGGQNTGLYRDDGLCCFQKLSGPDLEKIKKKMCKIFKENGLSITAECNLKITDFLDVTFDLRNGKYYPYKKDNNQLLYIHKQSNHPKSIIKQIPSMVSKRISDISCDKEHFEKAAPAYNAALKNSGYDENITYNKTPPPRKNRSRNIIWFNPPYSINVKTNIGKSFLNLIDKHFPREHKYRKLFNRNNVKISYSCMPSMANVIKKHNTNLMNDQAQITQRECNCRHKEECPMEGKCLSNCVVYNATVETLDLTSTKNYYGTSEGTFKERYNNHTASFRNKTKEKSTELSKHIWELKDNNIPYQLKWCIAYKARPYVCGSKKCDLCLSEKLAIIKADPSSLLNTRDELVSKCRHRNKFALRCFKEK